MTAPGYYPGDDPLAAYDPELVLLSPDHKREALISTGEPGLEERHTIHKIVVLTLAAVLAVKALDWLRHAKEWETSGRFDQAEFERTFSAEFVDRLSEPLVPHLSRLLLLGRNNVAEILTVGAPTQQATDRIAQAWARGYARKVSEDYARTSASAIATLLPEWLSKNLPATAMAARARDVYGLDPRASAAVSNYAAKISRNTNARALIDRYLEHRARANASVYVMSAQNSGREMLFTELLESGLVGPKTKKVWVTAHDERTCPVCKPMDGRAVRLNATFLVAGSELVTPPVHANCRCTISIDARPRTGFVFPKRFDLLSHWVDSAIKTTFS